MNILKIFFLLFFIISFISCGKEEKITILKNENIEEQMIELYNEGYTEFFDGTRLQPECGSLVFFPATWTYVHRGKRPKVCKYLCNGWIYAKC